MNAQPSWPAGSVEVLRAAGAQEKAIPYCVGWVQRFFASHPGRRRRDLGRGEIEASLAEMARHPGVSNWQVQQARDALELYYEQFRGIALEPRPETPTSHGIPPAGTEAASPDAKPHASVFREPPFRSDVAEAQDDCDTHLADVKGGASAAAMPEVDPALRRLPRLAETIDAEGGRGPRLPPSPGRGSAGGFISNGRFATPCGRQD